jgi:hypothetical protein
MPLVVPTICRYTLHGSYGGRPCDNVLDYHVDTTGSTVSRNDAIAGLAIVILDKWWARFGSVVTSEFTFQSVSWVDLNSATGVVGQISTTPTNSLPKTGTGGTGGLAGNTAVLITKMTASVRGARSGRMYMAGLPETGTTNGAPNLINSTFLGQFQTAATGFYNDTHLTGGGPTSYDAAMHVTHILTYDPPVPPHTHKKPATGEGHPVSSLVVNTVLATQRRRLRG